MKASLLLSAAFMASSVFGAPRVVTKHAVVYVTEEGPAVTVKGPPTPCPDKKVNVPKFHKWVHKHTSTIKYVPAPKPTTKPVYVPPPVQKPKPTTTPAAVTEPSKPSGSMSDKCVATHNELRAKHGASPVSWSDELAGWALEAANACAGHSGRQGVGENWAASFGSTTPPDASDMIYGQWYEKEVTMYQQSPGVFSMQTGHFTQLVWKGTSEIGCGLADCGSGKYVFICQYRAPGNYAGEFEKNVQAYPSS